MDGRTDENKTRMASESEQEAKTGFSLRVPKLVHSSFPKGLDPHLSTSGRLYLRPLGSLWYSTLPVGESKLKEYTKTMAKRQVSVELERDPRTTEYARSW